MVLPSWIKGGDRVIEVDGWFWNWNIEQRREKQPGELDTILLVRDTGYERGKQRYETPENRSYAIEGLQEEEQNLAGNTQANEGEKNLYKDQEEIEILDEEKDNAANSHITRVHFRKE